MLCLGLGPGSARPSTTPTRQIGVAVGVAVIGSVVSTIYTSHLTSASSALNLTAAQLTDGTSSLGAAQQVAASLTGANTASFVSDANEAFVSALATGLRVRVGVTLFAAYFAWRHLPARATHEPAPALTYAGVNAGPVAASILPIHAARTHRRPT